MKMYNEEVNSADEQELIEFLEQMRAVFDGKEKRYVWVAVAAVLVSLLAKDDAVTRRMTFMSIEGEVERCIKQRLLSEGGK
jgi:hypothetical protein